MSNLAPRPLRRDALIYVAGHRGLVGSAIWRHLQGAGFTRLVGRTSRELDLRDRDAVMHFVGSQSPDCIIIAAAKVGGIFANASRPADFLSDNLQIQVNLLDAAQRAGVQRLLFLGSSCIYPKFAKQPIQEDSLLTGALEPSNDAYAIAKIAGLMQVQAVRRQHGLPWISAMPTNLYGPGDNFHPTESHVLPGLLRRFSEATEQGLTGVTCWGSGQPRREFLHVDDLAEATLFLLETYDAPETIDVGTGADVTIRELAEIIARTVGYRGAISWDTTKPDGTPRKLLDVSRLTRLGWSASTGLEEGLRSTYDWYLEHASDVRT